MVKVVITVAKTESGYCAACEILPGWVVAVSGDLAALEQAVRESIDFYLACARADNEAYPEVFDGKFSIEYRAARLQVKSKK